MTKYVTNAWRLDITNRIDGAEKLAAAGSRVNAHEIKPGLIYRDANIRVTAFSARHGEMKNSFGYRFDTPNRTVVISGDTAPTEAIVEHSRGCDILIHEAYSQATLPHGYEKMAGLPPRLSHLLKRVGGDCQPSKAGAAGSLSSRKPGRDRAFQSGASVVGRGSTAVQGRGRYRPRPGRFLNPELVHVPEYVKTHDGSGCLLCARRRPCKAGN